MQVRSRFKHEGRLPGAILEGATGKQRDELWQSTLPKPRVIFQSARLRVTMRYDEEDWRACYVIEEKHTDAMNAETWTEIDEEIRPLHTVLGEVFDFLAIDNVPVPARIIDLEAERDQLRAVIRSFVYASDGCKGHAECDHSMEPWQNARILIEKWDG